MPQNSESLRKSRCSYCLRRLAVVGPVNHAQQGHNHLRSTRPAGPPPAGASPPRLLLSRELARSLQRRLLRGRQPARQLLNERLCPPQNRSNLRPCLLALPSVRPRSPLHLNPLPNASCRRIGQPASLLAAAAAAASFAAPGCRIPPILEHAKRAHSSLHLRLLGEQQQRSRPRCAVKQRCRQPRSSPALGRPFVVPENRRFSTRRHC